MADARLIPYSTLYYFKIVGVEASVATRAMCAGRCNKVLNRLGFLLIFWHSLFISMNYVSFIRASLGFSLFIFSSKNDQRERRTP